MKQEERDEVRRWKDLHDRGRKQGIYTFTGFLNVTGAIHINLTIHETNISD